jgi:anti-anti-sigma regulatory factor
MELRLTDHWGLPRLLVAGPIEAYEAAMMTDAVREQIERSSRLLLEFTGSGFVSATIIGHLIWLQRLARSSGGEIVIVRPPRLLCRSLKLLESSSVFRCFPAADEAAAALQASGVAFATSPRGLSADGPGVTAELALG